MENELIDQPNSPKNTSKLAILLIMIFCIVLTTGRFFKLLHWPFAAILITTGGGGLIGAILASLNVAETSLRKLTAIGIVIATCLFLYFQGFNYKALILIVPTAIIIYLVLHFHYSRRKKASS